MLANYQTGAEIVDGKLKLDDPQAFKTAMWRMKPGRKVVRIEDEEARRSSQANRYLWGVVYAYIHDYTGQDPETIHDEMCARFTTETISYTNPATGELVEMEVVRRTSGMKVSRFHRFVEDVRLFAAEFFGLTIPDPDPEYYRERERAEKRERAA